MWCIKPRTMYVVSVGGVALFSALCLCSVLLPGWAAKITEVGDREQTVYAGLFWMCFNGTFTSASCVSGNPFEHTALEVTTKFLVLAGLLFQLLSVLVALCHLTCCCYCCCYCWWWCCCRYFRCCCRRHHHRDHSNYQRYHLRRQLWHLQSSVVEVLAIGGGLIFFVGSLCAVGFVMTDTGDDYTFGPSLFLALASSTLVVNFGCLVFVSNRDSEDSPVFV